MLAAAFEEVVDCVRDTKMTSTDYFDEMAKEIKTAARCIRPMGILMTILGLFLLFMPIIELLNWIPLVGWLLGGIVAVAAFIFALVVGSVISCLVIAIAWVFYRPLIGILMLTMVGLGVYFAFFFDAESLNSLEGEITSAEANLTGDSVETDAGASETVTAGGD